MRQKPLGRSELTVSAVGLGCNNFGRRLDARGHARRDRRRARRGHHVPRHRRHLRRRRRQRAPDRRGAGGPARPRRAGDQVRHADERRRRRAARLARVRAARARGIAASACAPTASTSSTTTSPTASRRWPRRSARSPSWPDEGKIRAYRGLEPRRRAAARGRRRSAIRGSPRCRTSTACSSASAERELLPLCREHGIGFVPYFPLARGLLTGKFRRGEPPPGGHAHGRAGRSCSPTPRSTASRRSRRSPPSAATRCSSSRSPASRPSRGVASVIAGAMSPEQVAANAAAGAWELGADDLEALAAL